MKTQFTLPLFLLLLIIHFSCKGPKQPHDLSGVRAEISIFQSLQKKEDNEIRIDLSDEDGRSLKNDSIRIYVNGSEVPFIIKKELYYTETTYYIKANVPPQDNQFIFEIALPGAGKAFLAKATALDIMDPQNISYPETGNKEEDVEVTWKDLPAVNYLVITRGIKRKKKDEPNITYYEDETPDTVNITAAGRHTIARSTFDDTQKQISILSLKFIAGYSGVLHSGLAKGSVIRIYGDIERSVSFEQFVR